MGQRPGGDRQSEGGIQAQILSRGIPAVLCSQAAVAIARGPSWDPAAPSASEICSGWRPCTLRPHPYQAPTATSKRVRTVVGPRRSSVPLLGRSQLHHLARPAPRAGGRQRSGQHPVRAAGGDRAARLGPIVVTGLAPRTLRVRLADALGERRRLAFAAPGAVLRSASPTDRSAPPAPRPAFSTCRSPPPAGNSHQHPQQDQETCRLEFKLRAPPDGVVDPAKRRRWS